MPGAPPALLQQTLHGRAQTYYLKYDRTVRALNAANLAVYPVDARGLSTNPNTQMNLSTMQELAAGTGGKAYYNTNDIMNSIREAVEDSKFSYALGYYPEERGEDARYRTIRVKVNRPGLVVRHRRGYYYFGQPAAGKIAEAALEAAVCSPLDSTGVTMDAHAERRTADEIVLHVTLDASKIGLEPRVGRRTGKLDFMIVQSEDQGRQCDGRAQTFDLDFPESEYGKVVERGLQYRKVVRLKPETKTLRVVVRDVPTGSIGRVMIPLDRIPVGLAYPEP